MKNLKHFLPLLGIVACAAGHAQSSVTLFGDVDVGVQYLTHAGSNGGRTIGFQSGNEQPSRFGMVGREDLGDGYTAIFRLESGFSMANGSSDIAGTLFDRYAYVGLDSKRLGTLTAGVQRSILAEQAIDFEPTYVAEYSAGATNYVPVASFSQNNSIKWTSPTYAGISAVAMYGFGQQVAGNFNAGRFSSGALRYQGASLGAVVVYEQSHGTEAAGSDLSSKVDRRVNLALRYAIGDATLFASYTHVSGDLHLSPPGYTYFGGLRYMITPALFVTGEVAHYHTSDNEGQPTWYLTGATYLLSKSTSLYAYAGVLANHGGTSFTLNTYDFNSPGGFNQAGAMIGINHLF
ncbi:porin [Paraburkholderia sp. RL17-347-BIC-D]|uniref:porin n=1 Tax=Paraburkholderia sp. RL17-347-BIC-D TaxID=3031632 RepID=UPI0038B7338B